MSLAAEHYGAADFRRDTDVPRETAERLAAYADLLVRWQRRINLVGPATLADLWRRHMLDSAQFLDHAPGRGGTWVDLGSGAGFPGLVLAILGAGDVHLVESDGRKCAFLAEAARVTATPVRIHRVRAEALAGVAADVVVSRAFAPLPVAPDEAAGGVHGHLPGDVDGAPAGRPDDVGVGVRVAQAVRVDPLDAHGGLLRRRHDSRAGGRLSVLAARVRQSPTTPWGMARAPAARGRTRLDDG